MPAPSIYRSTDTNAPVLNGAGASLSALLDACLVNGYGSTFATATITSDGTNVADGDTVTIGSTVYTFRTSLTGQPAYAVLLGGSRDTSMQALAACINGNITSLGSTGTLAHPDVWTTQAAAGTIATIPLLARRGGAAANSITLARASSGTPHLTVPATMSGGGGTDSKVGAGWTKPFTGLAGQAVYRQGSSGVYLQVDEAAISTGSQREARAWGWETMTAFNTGSGQFPLPAQVASTSTMWRKSASLDPIARPWVLIGDDRTFYLLVQDGSTAGNYVGQGFGDYYSFVAADAFKCMIMAKDAENTSSVTSTPFGQHMAPSSGSSQGGHWIPRNYTGVGGSTCFVCAGDGVFSTNTTTNYMGVLMFPNGSDGGLYVAPVRVIDASPPSTSLGASVNLRGRLRGFYHVPYPVSSFADGDTFIGSGEYAGRTFYVVKGVMGNTANSSVVVFETTAWDTST